MKLMTLQQYMKMSKPALIRKIMKTLRSMPKKKLALACYTLTKAKLPQLKKGWKELDVERYTKTGGKEIKWYPRGKLPKRKTKRKARFKKGSPEAKRYMAKIRRMRK